MSGGYPYTTAGGGLANPAIGRTRRTFTLRDGRCFDLMAASGQIPMTDNTGPSPSTESPAPDDQLVLFGPPQPIRVRAELWRTWLDDPVIVSRFEAKRYLLRSAHACWIWTAGISSTGHGSFRAASLPGRSRRGTVPAHLFAYQLQHGVIPRLGWPGTDDPCLCHRCDEAGCVNPPTCASAPPRRTGQSGRNAAASHTAHSVTSVAPPAEHVQSLPPSAKDLPPARAAFRSRNESASPGTKGCFQPSGDLRPGQ